MPLFFSSETSSISGNTVSKYFRKSRNRFVNVAISRVAGSILAALVTVLALMIAAPTSLLAQQNEKQKSGRDVPRAAEAARVQYSGQWVPIGPRPTTLPAGAIAGSYGNTSGRVTAIVVDPTDASGNTVFIGAAQGGVWSTANGGATWTPLTDNQASLAMGALAITVDASNSLDSRHRVIYAGTGEMAATIAYDAYPGTGVFKSLDGGVTWSQTCQGPAFTNPSCPFQGPFTNGFYPGGGARIGSLAVNAGNPSLILAGVQMYSGSSITGNVGRPGIYCTNDAGATWAQILPSGLSGTALATSLFYVSSTTAYAALGDYLGDTTNGIYVSHNADQVCANQTWTRVAGTGLPSQSRTGWIELTAPQSLVNGQVILYAGIADAAVNSNNLLGVYRSEDAGATWTQLGNIQDFCATQCWHDMVIGVDPADATGNTVFFGGGTSGSPAGTTLLRTTDGGQTSGDFSMVGDGSSIHPAQHAIAFTSSGGAMYIANDGGVWQSTNAANPATVPGSQTWSDSNGTLELTQFYPGLSIHPSSPGISFGGTQGNGSQLYQGGAGSSSWTNTLTCGDGAFTAIDPNEQTAVYLSCAGFSGSAQIYKSTLGGQWGTFAPLASSSSIGNQPNGSKDPLAGTPPLIVDAQRAEHLYYGTYRLFETTDGANAWNVVSGDLTSGGLANGFALTSIAMLPLAASINNIYTGANDGTVEMAAGVLAGSNPTFHMISNGMPLRNITKVLADPSDSTGNTVYVAFAGFSVDESIDGSPVDLKGHLFKTTNGGANWTDISCHTSDCAAPLVTDLPDIPVNDIVLDPDDTSAHATIYAATDSGVFVTSDGGTTWAKLGQGLPNVAVFSLALHEPSRVLRASTHGRSLWDYPLPALAGTAAFALGGISPVFEQTGSTGFTLTLNGRGFTNNSQVEWNGSAAGVSDVQVNTGTQTITAQIAGNLAAQPGAALVSVSDSTNNPTVTNALTLTIAGSLPVLIGVEPSQVNAGASNTPITITGTGFSPGAFVTFNNSTSGVTSSSVNSAGTQVTATLSQTLLQFGGNFLIGVTNPPPGGGPATQELPFTVNAAGPPANDNFANATLIATATYTNTVDNSAATTEATDPTPSCAGQSGNPRGKSVWWRYSASTAGSAAVNTDGSSYDTILDVVTGTAGSFTEVACGHNAAAIGQTQTGFNTVAGTTYYFMVTVYDSTLCTASNPSGIECGGKTVLNFAGPLPDGVTAVPLTMSVTAGGSVSFNINTFAPPLSGQVTLSVSGCPTLSTCTFSSGTVTAGGASTLTVVTSASTTSQLVPITRPSPPTGLPRFLMPSKSTRWLIFALECVLLFIFAGSRRRVFVAWRRRSVSVVALLLVVVCFMSGCSLFGGATPPVTIAGTTSGTYSLVITATGGGNTTATTTLTLTVD